MLETCYPKLFVTAKAARFRVLDEWTTTKRRNGGREYHKKINALISLCVCAQRNATDTVRIKDV